MMSGASSGHGDEPPAPRPSPLAPRPPPAVRTWAVSQRFAVSNPIRPGIPKLTPLRNRPAFEGQHQPGSAAVAIILHGDGQPWASDCVCHQVNAGHGFVGRHQLDGGRGLAEGHEQRLYAPPEDREWDEYQQAEQQPALGQQPDLRVPLRTHRLRPPTRAQPPSTQHTPHTRRGTHGERRGFLRDSGSLQLRQ